MVHKKGTLSADDKKLLAIARNEISSEHAKVKMVGRAGAV